MTRERLWLVVLGCAAAVGAVVFTCEVFNRRQTGTILRTAAVARSAAAEMQRLAKILDRDFYDQAALELETRGTFKDFRQLASTLAATRPPLYSAKRKAASKAVSLAAIEAIEVLSTPLTDKDAFVGALAATIEKLDDAVAQHPDLGTEWARSEARLGVDTGKQLIKAHVLFWLEQTIVQADENKAAIGRLMGENKMLLGVYRGILATPTPRANPVPSFKKPADASPTEPSTPLLGRAK